jgi:hypothetical protein
MASKNKIKSFLLAGFVTGLVAVAYNVLIFSIFGFYPDFLEMFNGDGRFFHFGNPVFLIFVKDFFVGFILAFLFRMGCSNINYRMGMGIFFFILYSVFAFIMFSIGDLVLMRSNEGLIILLSLDGFIETLLCTIPIRFLSKDCFR